MGLSTKIPGMIPAVQGTHSIDNGDITWIVPHAKVHYPSNVPGVPFHHWCAAIAPATSIGHKGEVAGAKVLAGTLLDLAIVNPHCPDLVAWAAGQHGVRPALFPAFGCGISPLELSALRCATQTLITGEDHEQV